METQLFIALKALEAVRDLAFIIEEIAKPGKLSNAKKRILNRKAKIIKEHLPRLSGDLVSTLKKRRVLRISKKILEKELEEE